MLVNTWLCSRAMRFQSRPTNWPLLTIEFPVAQWLEHPTRSRRVVGSNPIWDSEFFSESTFLLIFNIVLSEVHVKCPVILICPPGDGIEVDWLM